MRRPCALGRWSRVVAILLATVVSVGATGLGHAGEDDLCDPVPVHHDHNAHRLKSGKLPTSVPEHCLFCHSFRLLGNGLIAAHAHVAKATGVAAIRTNRVRLAAFLLTAGTASRAPPVALL